MHDAGIGEAYDFLLQEAINTAPKLVVTKGWLLGWPLLMPVCTPGGSSEHPVIITRLLWPSKQWEGLQRCASQKGDNKVPEVWVFPQGQLIDGHTSSTQGSRVHAYATGYACIGDADMSTPEGE